MKQIAKNRSLLSDDAMSLIAIEIQDTMNLIATNRSLMSDDAIDTDARN